MHLNQGHSLETSRVGLARDDTDKNTWHRPILAPPPSVTTEQLNASNFCDLMNVKQRLVPATSPF